MLYIGQFAGVELQPIHVGKNEELGNPCASGQNKGNIYELLLFFSKRLCASGVSRAL